MNAVGDDAPALAAPDHAPMPKQSTSVMDGLSSSKVTVEYHDPSGLFPLIQEDLTARLPLRNLHWKAPTRPLRSIDSLHVDLVPSKETAQLSDPSGSGLAPPTHAAVTPTTDQTLKPQAKEKERRHQIPGLRQTPYLKIFLLRCDDSETYKSTARKQLREWVKEHTPPSQSSSSSTQENHDAHEWIILHVVLPDTPAASQSSATSSTAAGEKEKTGATSRWTRGTTTILEKIRADFNVSSKSAPDRVSQVRLQKGRVPPQMLPPAGSVTSPSVAESPQEYDKAWADLIARFKTLILLSFDLRVGQYEENIRKNEAQRSFPGWNFNTFFILKEGLARGFESVGLVEDALLGYDELSVGLDTVIRDQAKEGNETQGGVIQNYSKDSHQRAVDILNQSRQEKASRKGIETRFHDDRPIDAQKKDYRGLILANDISIFDFRIYIFARQMSLLLRLGNSYSARSDLANKLQSRSNTSTLQRSTDDGSIGIKSGSQPNDSEDLLSFVELCTRALNFITFAGRVLRDDLVNGAKAHDATLPDYLIDNIVRSWTFAALDQVLSETSTASLPFTKSSSSAPSGSSEKSLSIRGRSKEQRMSVPEPKSTIHPNRSTSLGAGRSSSNDPPYANAGGGQVVYENGKYQDRTSSKHDTKTPPVKNGQLELAGTRAHLLAIQRRLLEHVGNDLGWKVGWAAVLPSLSQSEEFTNVDLNGAEEVDSEDEEAETKKVVKPSRPTVGIFSGTMVTAVSSFNQFRQFYEALSDLIVKHYMAAGQIKSAESVLGDLAALRFELGDFAAAAMYFGRMASLFAESRWNTVETTMLKMYARCLKKLNRKDEYVRTLLDLLAKSAASRMSFKTTSKRASANDISDMPRDWLNDDKVDTTGVFGELINYSQQLPYDVTVQMSKYFGDTSVEPHVRHYDDKDGFQLRLQFRHVLEDEVEIKAVKIRLVSANSTTGKDIWLESSGPMQLQKGLSRLWLGCNVNTTGPYLVDKVVLEAKRIVFVHEPYTKAEAPTPLGITASVSASSLKAAKKSRILCYPRTESFDARVFLSHFIHIDKPRHIEVTCSTGWNEVERAEIRLKSASAGLRLRTANATTESEQVKIEDDAKPGVITIGALPASSTVTFKVPYDMETILQDLTVKIEIDYHTASGQFHYFSAFVIPVELPLDVNVHDHFKNKSLFSKFNIKTANQIPLEILDVRLEGSEEFDVISPRHSKQPLHVFAKQPVAVTYKITRKTSDSAEQAESRMTKAGSLSLNVEYRCLNEDVLDRLRAFFTESVTKGPVSAVSRLLINAFVNTLEQTILPPQYEKVALLRKVDMGDFDGMNWGDCVESLPLSLQDEVKSWLQEWHKANRIIHLPSGSSEDTLPASAPPSPYLPRHMVIAVAIPQTHILHTALLSYPSPSSGSPAIAVVGQPLMATLRISHSRRWATPQSLMSAAHLASESDPIEFIYTLEASPETWLIAGQRRAHFSAAEDEQHEFNIMLIPLKPGAALVPNVDIRARIKPVDDERRQSTAGVPAAAAPAADTEPLSCETDYRSYGETVMVVPDVRSSTVGIGDMSLGSPKSVVWMESVAQ